MAIDKSKWNTNIKVSQKTIDEIKKMGMAKALKTVAGAKAASKDDSSAKAWVEGVTRLYGANRVASATKSTSKSSSSSYPSPSSAGKNATTTSKPKPSTQTPKPVATKTVAQKDMYGNKVNTKVSISTPKPKASTPAAKKPAYKAPVQRDMYGNRIK